MKTGDNVDATNAGEGGISFVVRECRVPGSTETEKRVVWTGTNIQIQPNFRQIHEFLDYLATKWADILRRNEFFVDEFGKGPAESFPYLASKFPLRPDSIEPEKTPMFAEETIKQLVPFIRWCNENLKDPRIWSKFMNAQRQQRHWRVSGHQAHVVELSHRAHENLKALAKRCGISMTDFIEAISMSEDGQLSIDERRVREAKETDKRREKEVENFLKQKNLIPLTPPRT